MLELLNCSLVLKNMTGHRLHQVTHLLDARSVKTHTHGKGELHTVQDGLWSDWQREHSKELDRVERVAQRPTVQAQTKHLHAQRQLWRCFTS